MEIDLYTLWPADRSRHCICEVPLMEQTPQVTVIGIHRIPITDELVKGTWESFRPPSVTTEAFVRSFLNGVVLVEVLVTNADSAFDEYDIKQPSSSQSFRSWLDGVFLTPDGNELLAEPGYSPPSGHDTFRVAMWLRDWKDDEPLQSSYGQCDLPEFTPMPERLERLVPYSGD